MRLRPSVTSVLLILATALAPVSSGSQDGGDLVNAVIGNTSFQERSHRAPNRADEATRIRTHLETVASRLAGTDVSSLSPDQRRARARNIGRIVAYARAGRFPHNPSSIPGRAPNFMDASGAVCAVGYLVEQDRGRGVVEAIAREHQFDYVPYIKSPVLADWQASSGLSAIELATIQPTYVPPPPTPDLVLPFDVSASERAIDHTPPSAPSLNCVLIWRGWEEGVPVPAGNPYGRFAFVEFFADSAKDDRTLADDLGYRFEHVDGTLPAEMQFPTTIRRSPLTHVLYLTWIEKKGWDREPFYFRVAVRSIDRAGNESERSNVVIVGHDGDVKFMKAYAMRTYFLASIKESERAARRQLPEFGRVTMDTIRVDDTRTSWASSPASIASVYSPEAIELIEVLGDARVDRVTPSRSAPDNPPYELEGLSCTETGREMSVDEARQLRLLLLRPRSYISDKYMCTLSPEYVVSFDRDGGRCHVLVGSDCHQVGILGPDIQSGGDLTREAAEVLRGLCQGLFKLGPLPAGAR